MSTWSEIQKIYNKDSKIFQVLSMILVEGQNSEFTNSIRNFKSPNASNLSVLDIVFARQRHLHPELDPEETKVMLHLLPEEEFTILAIEAVESLLEDFKKR
jgi:hypothetical protein